MSQPAAQVFFDPLPDNKLVRKRLAALATKFPKHFRGEADARDYLDRMFVPRSRRWAFMRNSKTGNSSVIEYLFQLEFGHHVSASFVNPNDINEAAAVHRLIPADVFRQVTYLPGQLDDLTDCLRITTARHPVTRAVSSFRYICRSDELEHNWFLSDRLRMTALTGFDWSRHRGTADGFLRFLDYIRISRQEAGKNAINRHWRPQRENVLPGLFKPDLIGRLEDLDSFRAELMDRLGAAGNMPPSIGTFNANPGKADEDKMALLTPEVRRSIEDVYAIDFKWLGYDPDNF